MHLMLISGSGIGAGKSTLAHCLAQHTFSLADEIRKELAAEYPLEEQKFWNRTQEGKLLLVADTGRTVRDLLIERGQTRRAFDPGYWATKLYFTLVDLERHVYMYSRPVVAVDDIRFLNEVEILREVGGADVVHIHISHLGSIPEPQYESEQLERIADYVIRRNT